jgi:hypothetical protein
MYRMKFVLVVVNCGWCLAKGSPSEQHSHVCMEVVFALLINVSLTCGVRDECTGGAVGTA